MKWSYDSHRAMLVRDGRNFAIVTPDGKNALSVVDERILIDALNRTAVEVKTKPVAETNHELAL